jgi:hypothetical protein
VSTSVIMFWPLRDKIMLNVLVDNNINISLFFQFVAESFLYFYVTAHNGLPRIIKSKKQYNNNKIIIQTTDKKTEENGGDH